MRVRATRLLRPLAPPLSDSSLSAGPGLESIALLPQSVQNPAQLIAAPAQLPNVPAQPGPAPADLVRAGRDFPRLFADLPDTLDRQVGGGRWSRVAKLLEQSGQRAGQAVDPFVAGCLLAAQPPELALDSSGAQIHDLSHTVCHTGSPIDCTSRSTVSPISGWSHRS